MLKVALKLLKQISDTSIKENVKKSFIDKKNIRKRFLVGTVLVGTSSHFIYLYECFTLKNIGFFLNF